MRGNHCGIRSAPAQNAGVQPIRIRKSVTNGAEQRMYGIRRPSRVRSRSL